MSVCASVAMVLAIGCHKQEPAPLAKSDRAPPGAPGSAAPSLTPAGFPAASSRKPLRIAMIAKSATNPSFLSMRRGAEDEAAVLAAELGSSIEVDWMTPPREDGPVQAQRILQAVNEHVDAILLSCSDDQDVSVAIDDAVARGVPVMTFDSDAPASRRFSYIGLDDFNVGTQVMAELAKILPRHGRKPIEVAVLAGNRGAPNLRRRVEGALAEAARHPHLKVIGTFFHAETPQDADETILHAGDQFPAIRGWAMLGGWPLYTKTLLSELTSDAGRSRFKIVAFNALPPQLIYIEKGIAPVLLAQPNYLLGARGVEAIVDKVLLNKTVPALLPVELVRVTSSNLGTWARQLKAWGFADVPEEYLRMK